MHYLRIPQSAELPHKSTHERLYLTDVTMTMSLTHVFVSIVCTISYIFYASPIRFGWLAVDMASPSLAIRRALSR